MEIDLRLTTTERLGECLSLPVRTISIGHEACPHKLPSTDELKRAAETIREHGKRFAFVAPICYERFVGNVLERVQALVEAPDTTIVVNDFGLLLLLADRGWHKVATVAVGHGLSYTFEQQPWFDLTLARESAEAREGFYRNSLDDPQTWPFLKECGVTAIEVDALPRTAVSFDGLRNAGFRLNMLIDVVPVAYARSCHTARYHKAVPPNCTQLCERPFELTTTDHWRLMHNQLEPIPRRVRENLPQFTVYGNVVYRSTEGLDMPSFPIDTVTLDVRYYAPEQLKQRITLLTAGDSGIDV